MNQGLKFRVRRISKLMTQAEMAAEAGCLVSDIDALERGNHTSEGLKRKITKILDGRGKLHGIN